MAIHIQDAETDALVRAFARQHNLGITEAVKFAVNQAKAKQQEELLQTLHKLEPIWAEIRARRKITMSEDEMKAYMDDMSGEND